MFTEYMGKSYILLTLRASTADQKTNFSFQIIASYVWYNVDMLNAIKGVLADVLSVSPSSEQGANARNAPTKG